MGYKYGLTMFGLMRSSNSYFFEFHKQITLMDHRQSSILFSLDSDFPKPKIQAQKYLSKELVKQYLL